MHTSVTVFLRTILWWVIIECLRSHAFYVLHECFCISKVLQLRGWSLFNDESDLALNFTIVKSLSSQMRCELCNRFA